MYVELNAGGEFRELADRVGDAEARRLYDCANDFLLRSLGGENVVKFFGFEALAHAIAKAKAADPSYKEDLKSVVNSASIKLATSLELQFAISMRELANRMEAHR